MKKRDHSLRTAFGEFLHSWMPSFLGGLTCKDWIRLLRDNHWDVDIRYYPRALAVTLFSILTSLLRMLEPKVILHRDEEEMWANPLFVLGLPRSGTTHLCYLLSRNQHFAETTRLDVYNPHTFVLLRKLGIDRLLSRLQPKKRVMDQVMTGWLTPEEDDLALAVLCQQSERLRSVFPRRRAQYDEFSQVMSNDHPSRAQWIKSFRFFTQKLVSYYRKPLLLKSPNHCFHLSEILEIFPMARFVFISRDPIGQFSSYLAMVKKSSNNWCTLQNSEPSSTDEVLARIKLFWDRYSETRNLIPPDHLVEVRYEDLVSRRDETLAHIHRSLGLNGCEDLLLSLQQDKSSPKYKTNSHHALDPSLREQVISIYASSLFPHQFKEGH